MERDIEKDLIEIECAIKSQEEKDNIFTMSVLLRCHKLVSQLKEYKDLEEQGKLLKLPCAVGDTVYVLVDMNDEGKYTRVKNDIVKSIYIDDKGKIPMLEFTYVWHDVELSDIGKNVFLTQEEAEAELKEL